MDASPNSNGIFHSVCPHDCPDSCSILSTVKNGRLVKVAGNPDHPVTQGFLCRKFKDAAKWVYAEDRLLNPMKRVGKKGSGEFAEISWDEALAEITNRWMEVIDESGTQSILPFFGSGTEGLVHGHVAGRRFFNRLGSLQLERTICTKAGRLGYQYTMGTSAGADPTAIDNCDLIVDWGLNSASTNIHQQQFLSKARRNGAKYAVVNPVAVAGAEKAEYFLRPRPGTDAALALAMMQVIIEEGLWHKDFVESRTYGFEELEAHLQNYKPELVEDVTGISGADIRSFARVYGEHSRSFIYVGPGCQRHSNGGMLLRTLACLPALTGAWRHDGCGIYFPTSTCFPADFSRLEGDELRPNPAAKYNMLALGDKLADPDIKSLYVFNGNPAAVLYNQNFVRSGLAREDLFSVVHEKFLTDTARYADIVLPATTQFEQRDVHFSYYHYGLYLNEQAIDPVGESRSNLAVFTHLAQRMGFDDGCFSESEDDIIERILANPAPAVAGIDLAGLYRDGWTPAASDPVHEDFKNLKYPTPSGRIEFYSNTMADDGFEPLPTYQPPQESPDGSPELFERHPMQLLTPSGHSFHNASYGQDTGIGTFEDKPTILVHPNDAASKSISTGDPVRIFNDRGDCRLWAVVTKGVKEGVLSAAGQWWSRHYPDGGNANHTTPDFLADLGGGSAFNSNLVQIERVSDA